MKARCTPADTQTDDISVSRAHCNMTLFCVMLQCRRGTVQKAVCVTVPGLQRSISGREGAPAYAALRPGHTTDLLISGRALSLTLANFLTAINDLGLLFWDELISPLSWPSRDSGEI